MKDGDIERFYIMDHILKLKFLVSIIQEIMLILVKGSILHLSRSKLKNGVKDL